LLRNIDRDALADQRALDEHRLPSTRATPLPS
jgi:hypothetical protein